MDKAEKKKLQAKARSRRIGAANGGYERHLFMCSGPQCCAGGEGEGVYQYLTRRLGQLERHGKYFYRCEVKCLSFCRGGPLLVVYPEGVWYARVTREVCDRIIEEHLLNGQIVEEFAIARNPPGIASGESQADSE
jgi:(2Fe-2S) ferredoxin